MKKLLLIVGVLSLFSVLAACGGTDEGVVTEPSFVGVSVDGTNPYDGTVYETYYKEKNQSTMIEIVLDNPSSLEIRAIVINGYSYRYSKFTEDSTHNVIYLNLDPGTELGLTEYTVDDIEYFNGADTKDVLVNSNNEFHIYVFKNLPIVERENYSLGQESISVDFNILDEDGVIESGSLQVLLYEGSVLKETIDITTGFTRYGTHRSDIVIKYNQYSANDVLSRGQKKIIVICLILSQFYYLKKYSKNNNHSLLLLDDMDSELDKNNLNILFRILNEFDCQVLMTTTDKNKYDFINENSKLFHVEQLIQEMK